MRGLCAQKFNSKPTICIGIRKAPTEVGANNKLSRFLFLWQK